MGVTKREQEAASLDFDPSDNDIEKWKEKYLTVNSALCYIKNPKLNQDS